ncbi:class I SAM-dependent methyltransferase [Streptomyces sp. VRA16 Mangrove soil]|uniref:class I SAM-dependent methyltransferase n=1 Tax=Streptomyces sp. VRA16 Mangrove soil TaxID=2817434 RepID=UPI001E5121F2|nr:class I SAM-dependent methyltransferase [Streptomyces sp. VRA16 Mangrove soil]
MTHEDPLAYALGLEGIALIRAFTGLGPGGEDLDKAFVAARIAGIRALLDDPSLADAAVETEWVDTVEGYGIWSRTYDGADNPAFDYDAQPLTRAAATLPAGSVVLDAACGSGRLTAVAAGLGHRVIGVDTSPAMLALARRRVPGGTFVRGALPALPVRTAGIDLVTCSLALTHVPDSVRCWPSSGVYCAPAAAS